MLKYSHLVTFENYEGKRRCRIDHVFEGRKTVFLTYLEIEGEGEGEGEDGIDWEGFDHFAEILGKNICMDSPVVRAAYGIDKE